MAMSTERANAIRIAHSQQPKLDETEVVSAKAEHYAYLAKIIGPGIELLFSDEASLKLIHDSRHASEIHETIRFIIIEKLKTVLEYEGNDLLTEHINALHRLRSPHNADRFTTVESHLKAGIGTFLLSAQGLYEGLSKAFGVATASHPENADILDRIAKLHLQQLMVYTDTYLRPGVYEHSPFNIFPFKDQFEQQPHGHLRFKPGFPQSALISTITRESSTNPHRPYRFLNSTEARTLADEPLGDAPIIGCPVTFEPKHVRMLWELYATTRFNLEAVDALANIALASNQLDTAEQPEQTVVPSRRSVGR